MRVRLLHPRVVAVALLGAAGTAVGWALLAGYPAPAVALALVAAGAAAGFANSGST